MPTIRATSIEAYEDIKASGVLSQRLFETYEAVYRHPRSTRNELYAILQHHNAEGTYGRALSMLVNAGVIGVPLDSATGKDFKRPCNVSGSNCIVYEVLPNVPSKDELRASITAPKRPATQTIAKAVQDLRTLVRSNPSLKPSPELIEVAKWLRDLAQSP